MKCIRKFLLFILFFQIALFFFSCKDDILEPVKVTLGTFTDSRDGNVYKTTTIDGYTWLAEDLAFVTDSGSSYNNYDSVHHKGRDYTILAVLEAMPVGWHLPTSGEIEYLKPNLAGENVTYEMAQGWNFYSGLLMSNSIYWLENKHTYNGFFLEIDLNTNYNSNSKSRVRIVKDY